MATLTGTHTATSGLPRFLTNKMFAINSFLLSVWIFSIPFVEHAISAGLGFMVAGESSHPALNIAREGHLPIAIYALAAHMVAGGIVNFIAPLQVHLGLTQRSKVWHRRLGITVLVVAVTGAMVGTTFYALYPAIEGTRLMRSPANLQAGSLYGVAMFFIAFKVIQTLIRRDMKQHKIWAISMAAMAVGSYINRVNDGWVNLATSTFELSRPEIYTLSVVNAWAFWLAPLLMIHGFFALQKRGAFKKLPAYAPFVTSMVGIAYFGIGTYHYLAPQIFG
ncbi:MAG: DUF2306 domain-containing protein [Pseudomonadales bacterium]|nr:DUF2306 domain-containing protein [Pseudomonadales bacterium]